jgi:hypothetical protein
MNFNSNTTDYEIIHERFEVRKVNNIVVKIKELFVFNQQQLKKTKKIIESQINKHQQDVIYEVND